MDAALNTTEPITQDRDHNMTVIVALSVLLALFILATLGLLIYLLLKTCWKRKGSRDRGVQVDLKSEEIDQPVRSNLQVRIDSDIAIELEHDTISHEDTDSQTGEEEDQLQPLPQLNQLYPQISCRYKRRTLDVFTSDYISPQRASKIGIFKAAQVCYERQNEPVQSGRIQSIYDCQRPPRSIESILEEQMIPDIEQVEMVNVGTLGRAPTSLDAMNPVTPTEFRPKSFFHTTDGASAAAGSIESDVFHGMFVSKTLTSGEISLYGVTLSFPPGSLPEEQTITLGILWSADHLPKLPKKSAILSPIVSCEPHGLTLLKPATLTLPHCAHNAQEDWKLHILRSETKATAKTNWSKWSTAKMNHVKKNVLTVAIPNFTLYSVIGEAAGNSPAAKWMDLIAFAPPLQSTIFKTTIFCVNDYEAEEASDTQKMNSRMKKARAGAVTEPTKLKFYNDEKNLQLELSVDESCQDWRIAKMCAQKQELDFELVWHSACPSCTFILDSGKTKTSKVMCKVKGQQLGHDGGSKELYIAEEEQRHSKSRLDLSLLDPVFPPDLRDVIKKHLDADYGSAANWLHLAENMGKTISDTHWMTHDYREAGNSPTLSLLNDWVSEGKTLDAFTAVIKDLGRMDLFHEITSWKQRTKAKDK